MIRLDTRAKGGAHRFITGVLVIFLFALPALSLCPGCGGTEAHEEQPAWVQTAIYLGRNIPGGGEISEADFQEFLEEVVTEEFPKGLTVFNAYGQMQHDDGTIENQTTKVILLVHENNDANSEAVKRVIDSYRERFGNPQVMHTTSPIEVEFFPDSGASVKPTREEVVAFVEEAVEYAGENGKEEALAEFSDQNGRFKRGELYIYAYDFSGTVLAHGGDPSLVGEDLIDYEDPNGVKVIQELIDLARGGQGWLSYTWENAQTKKQEPKLGYVMKVDDTWWLGSGTYE